MTNVHTTIATLWRLVLRDDRVLGFCNHDRDIQCEGVDYLAANAQDISAQQTKLGFEGGDSEVFGAVDHDAIRSEDLENGVFDSARLYRINYDWKLAEKCREVFIGYVDGVTFDEYRYQMRIERSHPALSMRTGRSFVIDCDAQLGDDRCKLDLVEKGFYVDAIVEAATPNSVDIVSDAPAAGYLAGGVVVFDGDETKRVTIAHDTDLGGIRRLAFFEPARFDMPTGMALRAYWGCSHKFDKCVERFDNGQNFRGFPYLPTSLNVEH